MQSNKLNPSWRFGTILLIGISLSISWGIRGNFGHEYGAAFAGCLAAIAVALLSGREDWCQRVPYFAFFIYFQCFVSGYKSDDISLS